MGIANKKPAEDFLALLGPPASGLVRNLGSRGRLNRGNEMPLSFVINGIIGRNSSQAQIIKFLVISTLEHASELKKFITLMQ